MGGPREFSFFFESLGNFLQYCIYSSVYTVLYNCTVSDIVTEKIKKNTRLESNDVGGSREFFFLKVYETFTVLYKIIFL